MSISIVFSYPITIYPTNQVLQSFFLPCLSDESKLKAFLRFLLNGCVLLLGSYFSNIFYANLDTIIAFSGVVLGSVVILIIPTMCHYKIIASRLSQDQRGKHKLIDLVIIGFAVIVATMVVVVKIIHLREGTADL